MLALILLSRGGYGHTPRDDLDKVVAEVSTLLAGEDGPLILDAFVDRGTPSLPDALQACAERGATQIAVLPLFVPSDKNLQRWLAKVMVRWHSTWPGSALVLQMLPSLMESAAIGDAVVAALRQSLYQTENLLESPPRHWEKNPSGWSSPPPHRYHLLLCQGPRCTAGGASARWQYLRQRLREKKLFERENGALLVATDCLFPCNHGPVMVVHPDSAWYGVPTAQAVDTIVSQHLEGGEIAQEYVIHP
ncbi:MAG: CbiX/SirB N-terminal domain-containing protein [Chloroflexota bacterium]